MTVLFPGGVADTVAKWVFKQDICPGLVKLAREKKDSEGLSAEEPEETCMTVALLETQPSEDVQEEYQGD